MRVMWTSSKFRCVSPSNVACLYTMALLFTPGKGPQVLAKRMHSIKRGRGRELCARREAGMARPWHAFTVGRDGSVTALPARTSVLLACARLMAGRLMLCKPGEIGRKANAALHREGRRPVVRR